MSISFDGIEQLTDAFLFSLHHCKLSLTSLRWISLAGKVTLFIIYYVMKYHINITFPGRVIVENIIPRNVIINRGAAEVDNHLSRDDIFHYHPSRKCNIYFIIPNRTLDPLFSEVLLLLNRPIMVRGDPKGK